MSKAVPYLSSRRFRLIRRHALWILVSFCVALSYFAGSNLAQKTQERYDALVIRTWTEVTVEVNALVHALQKERGLSSGYLATRGEQFERSLT